MGNLKVIERVANKFVLGNSETMGHRQDLATRVQPGALHPPYSLQIWLRAHDQISFLEWAFRLNLLGRKQAGSKVLSELLVS